MFFNRTSPYKTFFVGTQIRYS